MSHAVVAGLELAMLLFLSSPLAQSLRSLTRWIYIGMILFHVASTLTHANRRG